MLQQILSDMYIEPELLAELDDEQKQILFCKMREEQIRRWKERERATEMEEQQNKVQRTNDTNKERGQRVSFLEDGEGRPWTWVMGEHADDKSVEQMLDDEAQLIARQQAETETCQLRNAAEDCRRQKSTTEEAVPTMRESSPLSLSVTGKVDRGSVDVGAVPGRTAAGDGDLESTTSRRSDEIFASLRLNKQRSCEQAEREGKSIVEAWKEQERKAKQADEERRLIARRVREEHVRAMRRLRTESQIIGSFVMTSDGDGDDTPTPGGTSAPPGRTARPSDVDAVMAWYREVEEPKGIGIDPSTGQPADYFYGFVTRQEAEEILSTKTRGTFLVRLSDRIWGYALSYRADARCRHYLIDAGDGCYRFFGTGRPLHRSLHQLVDCHKTVPLSIIGNELLVNACGATRQTDNCTVSSVDISHF